MAVTATERTVRESQERYQGERITGRPLRNANINDVRRGTADVSDLPWLNPVNYEAKRRDLANRRENGFDRSNAEHRKELSNSLREIANGPEKAREIAAYRNFELTNDVMVTPFALGPFQEVDLNPDELPLIVRPRSKNMQRFRVTSYTIDGGAHSDQWRTTKSASSLEMEAISTDRVEYNIWDIQQGDISENDALNESLQLDMAMKMDSLALTNINAAGVNSGLRALLSFHPLVDQANVPDANQYNLDTLFPGNPDVLTLPKLKYILNHIALLMAAYPEEGLAIQTIMLSPQNMRDAWDFTDLVSETAGTTDSGAIAKSVTPATRQAIFNTGMMTSAWGMNFSWTPNTQIAKGKMYVFFNQPIGWLFTKKSFDRSFEWNESNSPDHAENGIGEIMWRRVFAFYTVDLWKHRILIIDL